MALVVHSDLGIMGRFFALKCTYNNSNGSDCTAAQNIWDALPRFSPLAGPKYRYLLPGPTSVSGR